jgi:hypothetical protein
VAYTTVSELKSYLGGLSTADDSLLQSLIETAAVLIDNYCGRADATRKFDAVADVEGLTLRLDKDLAQITSVANGDGAALTVNTHYVTNPRNDAPYRSLQLLPSSGVLWAWTTNPQNAISVTGRWARWVTAQHPIPWAAKRTAAYLFRQRDNLLEMERPVIIGNVVELPIRLPRDVEIVLRPYRKVST